MEQKYGGPVAEKSVEEAFEKSWSAVQMFAVVVPVPCTTKFSVVVAPPEMVRPVACPPAPIVEEARE